jgi:hypothetical protein
VSGHTHLMRCLGEEVERLDAELASLARVQAALRLRLGQVLEALSGGGCFELGFSSLAAYALERCDRSVRWAEGARCLARRVERLPELRRALAMGRVSWSMGELLASVAQPGDEARWIELAESQTVRRMRELVMQALSQTRGQGGAGLEDHAARWVAPMCGASDGKAADDKPSDCGTREAGDCKAADCKDGEGGDCTARGSGQSGDCNSREGGNDNAGHDNAADGNTRDGRVRDGRVRDGRVRDGQVRDGQVRDGRVRADDGCEVDGEDDDRPCTLTCTVDQEDAWLFEATRALLGQLGVHGTGLPGDAECEALLAEAQGTLLAALPEGALDAERWEWRGSDQQSWLRELAGWRAEAEARCEERIPGLLQGGTSEPICSAVAVAAAHGLASLVRAGAKKLDRKVRGLSRALAGHELELSRRVLRFHRADGWRRLGYATATQYARERLGLSPSSLLAKRALALRLERLPRVAAALGAGQIGVEAAVQVVRVATRHTEAAWVERARQRTIKHLREEVAAALIALRLSGEADCPPPADTELAAFHELERAVVSGRACQAGAEGDADVARAVAAARRMDMRGVVMSGSAERRAWLEMLGSLARWLENGLRLSAGGGRGPKSGAGRVELRLRMSRATHAWWRGLEAQARRWLPRGMSWVRFLCLAMWQAWRHLLGADVAYGQIYIRDRFRCRSPVCSRRDVTPHHLRFRSAGGSDEAHNMTSVCCWCHLEGVHGGRIRAVGTANDIRWELGEPGAPCLVVQGRKRVAA